jgi:transposase InsO family protein
VEVVEATHEPTEALVSHANARLNLHGRRLLVRRVIGGRRPVAHVAKELGISRQCAHRWLARYRTEGDAGLHERSSRPRSSPRRTSPDVEQRILTFRAEHRCGQDEIGAQLAIAPRTVARVLRRHGVPLLRHCDPLTGDVIRASKTTAVRYERARPGELVHVDVKKIGRIPDGGGWRARAQTTANHQSRVDKKPLGYDFVHSMVDDHSRLAYSEVLPTRRAPPAPAFLARSAAYFAHHGIPRIERVMTDNAFAYRHSLAFRQAATAIGARQTFIKPHCPWQNGKVERLNRTLQTEWAYRQVFTTNADRAAALAPWLDYYNTRRRHHALGGLPPTSRLSPT